MLKIGDFSMLTKISICMLRHYDKIGLLVPNHVDSVSGYRYYDEDKLWEMLKKEMNILNIHTFQPNYNIAIYHNENPADNILDIEVQKAITGKYENKGNIKFKNIEAITAATMTYKGSYKQVKEANQVLANWVKDNKYELSGSKFNMYHIPKNVKASVNNMVVEVCIPVKSS